MSMDANIRDAGAKLAKMLRRDEKGDGTQTATVTRIDEDGTVWVSIAGREVPSRGGVAAGVGDRVSVRLNYGNATVTDNLSHPPTDDTAALSAQAYALDAQDVADQANEVAGAIAQNFFTDERGVHVTSDYGNPDGDRNVILNSLGMVFRNGINYLLAIVTGSTAQPVDESERGVAIYDGLGNLKENIVAFFGRFGIQIGRDGDNHLTINENGLSIVSPGGSYGEVNGVDVVATASTANAAKSTADTAKANAATAQSTANTAKSAAAAAQTSADDAAKAADEANALAATANGTANKTKENFWADSSGVHVSTQASTAAGTFNSLFASSGMLFRAASNYLLSLTASALNFYDGSGNNAANVTASFGASSMRVGKTGSGNKNVLVDSDGVHVRDNTTDASFFGASAARIGKKASPHLYLSLDGVGIDPADTDDASLTGGSYTFIGATAARVGPYDKAHLYITPNLLSFSDANYNQASYTSEHTTVHIDGRETANVRFGRYTDVHIYGTNGGFGISPASVNDATDTGNSLMAATSTPAVRVGPYNKPHVYLTGNTLSFNSASSNDTAITGTNSPLFLDGSTPAVRIGKYGSPHVYVNSSGVGINPASVNDATATGGSFAMFSGTAARIGLYAGSHLYMTGNTLSFNDASNNATGNTNTGSTVFVDASTPMVRLGRYNKPHLHLTASDVGYVPASNAFNTDALRQAAYLYSNGSVMRLGAQSAGHIYATNTTFGFYKAGLENPYDSLGIGDKSTFMVTATPNIRIGPLENTHVRMNANAFAFCVGGSNDVSITGTANYVVLNDSSEFRLGKYASPHLFINSTSLGFYPASSNTAADAMLYATATTVRLGKSASPRTEMTASALNVYGQTSASTDVQNLVSIGKNAIATNKSGLSVKVGGVKSTYLDSTYAYATNLYINGIRLNKSGNNLAITLGSYSWTDSERTEVESYGTVSIPMSSADNRTVAFTSDITTALRSYLPLSGGTLTGNLVMKKATPSYLAEATNVDATKANNNLSSGTVYPAFYVDDANGKILARFEAAVASGGNIAAQIYARNYDTSGNQTVNNLSLGVKKDGTRYVSVSESSVWRNALGASAAGVWPISMGGTGQTTANAAARALGLAKTAGDTITGIRFEGSGYLTASRKSAYFTISLGVLVYSVSTVNLTAGTAIFRQNNSYHFNTTASTSITLKTGGKTSDSAITYTAYVTSNGMLTIVFTANREETSAVNDSPFAVSINGMTVAFS